MTRVRTIHIPRFLHVAAGATADLPAHLAAEFDVRRVILATGEDATSRLAQKLADGFAAVTAPPRIVSGLRGTLAEANELLATIDVERPTLVVAVGGGRPIDVAKLAASRARVDMVSVPTSLSHDGMASPVASLAFPDGARQSLGAGMPAGVVIDLDIVRDAPARNLRAGIGDLVSNLIAVHDWRLAETRVGEPFDEFAASLALQSALPVLHRGWPADDTDLELVARGLVMSGLAMEIAGTSRPCSGADHLISHALDAILGKDALLHGEQVAIGCLVASTIHGKYLEEYRDLFRACGLPVRIDDCPFDVDVIVEAVRNAPAARPDRYTILSETDLSEQHVRSLVATAFDDEPRPVEDGAWPVPS